MRAFVRPSAAIFVFLVLVVFGIPFGTGYAQDASQITIVDINFDQFPDIDLQVRAWDSNGKAVTSLAKDDFTVVDDGMVVNHDDLSYREVEGEIWVHFVVDAGAGLYGSNANRDRWINNIKPDLDEFAANWQQNNSDHVSLTFAEANGRRTDIDFANSIDDFQNGVNAFSPGSSSQFSDPLNVLEDVVDELAFKRDAADQPRFVVFVTAGLETGSRDQLDQILLEAQQADIQIYTKLLRDGVRSGTAAGNGDLLVEELATATGGQFTSLATNALDIEEIYQEITNFRTQYTLEYRSQSGSSGTRQVEVQLQNGANSSADYTVDIVEPRAIIASPSDGAILQRKADSYTDDLLSIEPTETTIVAEVRFTDGYVRNIVSADLLSGDVVLPAEVSYGVDQIEFIWDLSFSTDIGSNNFALDVELQDELGFIFRSVQPVNVEVVVDVPEEPTAMPETDSGSTTEIIVVTAEPVSTPVVLQDDPQPTLFEQYGTILLTVLGILILLVLALIAAFLVLRQRKPEAVSNIRQTAVGLVQDGITRITRVLGQTRQPRAYLLVLSGDENSNGKMLEIYGETTIGRDRREADLLFQQNEDNSPISRLHCTIIDDEDRFLIRDDDSTNGTYLNGSRLEAMREEDLEDGDEIEVARVERGGVKLLFQLADDQGQAPQRMRETKRIIDSHQTQMGGSEGLEDRF